MLKPNKNIDNRRGEVPSPCEVSPDIKGLPIKRKSETDENKGGETPPLQKDLAAGWVIAPMNNVCTIILGQSPPSSTYNANGEGLPFFQGKAEFGERYPIVVKWCSKPKKVAQKNDILISVRAPVGPTNIAPSECCIGRGLAAIRPLEGAESLYIFYFLRSIEHELSEMGTGTTFKAISGSDLRSISIPLAPLDQQKLIVAEIEKQFSRLDEAVTALKRIQANLKRYKASVLKAAVEGKLTEQWRKEHPDVEPGSELLKRTLKERRKKWEEKNPGKQYKEPVAPVSSNLPELPEGWGWATTDQLFFFVTSGSRGWAKYYSDDGPIFLRIGNLDHGTIKLDLTDIRRVRPPQNVEGSRTRVVARDILISITADVGMIGVIPSVFEEAYINQHISLARPIPLIDSLYLAWFLSCKNGQDQFQSQQRGATKLGLGLDDIKSVIVPLPPLAEQHLIVQEIERLFSVTEEIESSIESNIKRTERLRQSILKKAFSGNLVQ